MYLLFKKFRLDINLNTERARFLRQLKSILISDNVVYESMDINGTYISPPSKDALRKRRSRTKQTDDMKMSEAQRKFDERQLKTPEQKSKDQQTNSQHMQSVRANRTPDEIAKDQQALSQRMQTVRANRTPDEIVKDREANNLNIKNLYAKRKEKQKEEYRKQAADPSEFRLSPMNIKCIHCGALHFAEEQIQDKKKAASFNDCCGHGRIFL
jgi:hypothetical protein